MQLIGRAHYCDIVNCGEYIHYPQITLSIIFAPEALTNNIMLAVTPKFGAFLQMKSIDKYAWMHYDMDGLCCV
jgi:hypothetical protein